MQLENVGTDTLDWMMYYMAIEKEQASLALYDDGAPTTSRLAHTNPTTQLQRQVRSTASCYRTDLTPASQNWHGITRAATRLPARR